MLLAVFVLEIGLLTAPLGRELRPSPQWWGLASLTAVLVMLCLFVPFAATLLELQVPDRPALGAVLLSGLAAALFLRVYQTTSR